MTLQDLMQNKLVKSLGSRLMYQSSWSTEQFTIVILSILLGMLSTC